jgi:hypothetical protein
MVELDFFAAGARSSSFLGVIHSEPDDFLKNEKEFN